jgi:RNA polymerase sigma-70 factor (ECF subfamily)
MISKWEEIRLIAQCIAGDNRQAFEQLVNEYKDGLRRFLLNLTLGDASLTDDLAQETFIKAYLSLRSFKGVARFKTWLYRIAYNEYYAHLRKNTKLRLDDSVPIIDTSESSENASDANMDVQRCLHALNETERSIVLLFYMDDRPLKEIAAIMQMPEGTVKSHLSRSKAKMAKVFN